MMRLDGVPHAATPQGQGLRFCLTLFLILTLFFLSKLQQEKYEQTHKRRHKTELKDTWEYLPFLNSRWPGMSSVYLQAETPAGFVFRDSDSTSLAVSPYFELRDFVFGYQETPVDFGNITDSSSLSAHEWLSRSSYRAWLFPNPSNPVVSPYVFEKTHVAKGDFSTDENEFPAGITAAYLDTHFFLTKSLPGCNSRSVALRHCYIALVRFPRRFCLFDDWKANSDDSYGKDTSWTCEEKNSLGENNPFMLSNVEKIKSCIRVMTGISLENISRAARRMYLGKKQKTGKNGKRSSWMITQFCGYSSSQLIAFDAISGQLYFVQPMINIQHSKKQGVRSKNEGEETYQNEGIISKKESFKINSDSPVIKNESSQNASPRVLYHKENVQEHYFPTSFKNTSRSTPNRSESSNEVSHILNPALWSEKMAEPADHVGPSPYCISSVSINNLFEDVTECIPIPTIDGDKRNASYMHFDHQTHSLVVFHFDKDHHLIITILKVQPIRLRYSVKVHSFHSVSDYTSGGQLLLIGDNPPYRGSLQVIDLDTGTHRRMDLYRDVFRHTE